MLTTDAYFSSNRDGLFIGVEGNIGSGKTEFCHMLRRVRQEENGPCEVLLEPVNKDDFKHFLGLYYEDPKRWGLTFQLYALKERFKQHTWASELASNGIDVVQDRTIYADGCFGRCVHADGNMSDSEWRVYGDFFGSLKRFLRYPDVFIYLRTDPKVCKERMDRRARSEESGVPLDYLQRIHDEHERYMEEMASFSRVLRVDWGQFGADIPQINKQVEELVREDKRFLRDWHRI